MISLAHAPIAVHSNYEAPPLPCPSVTPAYRPTRADELYLLGLDLGLEGYTLGRVDLPAYEPMTRAERLRLALGLREGRAELQGRLESVARELREDALAYMFRDDQRDICSPGYVE